jgi:mycobactin lysine-N-oxygenase
MGSAMTKKNIAVIGGGAKAAALAAKAYALRQEGVADIGVTIFEQDVIGANWNGRAGYTDGAQRLCTPAERDLGFPYTTILGEPVASFTLKEFSWATFLGSRRPSYRDWVDGGRRPPTHEDFASYLGWSVKKSDASVVQARVSRLSEKGDQWRVLSKTSAGSWTAVSDTLFDGVVVTGPGPARGISKAGSSDRVFNGIDFWQRTGEIRKLLPSSRKDGQIAIIGAGGTAAAVLAWLCKNGHRDREIFIIADQGALYTRGDSVFENRLFSDDEAWNSLSASSKREFFDRLNRGVVWGTVMNEVATASRVRFQNGRATRVAPQSTHVEITVRRGDAIPVFLRPELLIDAAGFDSWWFLNLLTGVPPAIKRSDVYKDALRDGMNESLEFEGAPWTFPRLHAPMLSSTQGPGYGNLMALGAMSDLILRSYL